MTHQVTVTYDARIIRKGVGHFWFRFIAWHGFVMIAGALLGCFALLVAGNRSWMVGALGAMGVMSAFTAASVYVVFLRRSLWKFNRMTSKSVRFTFTEERFCLASDLGSSELSWKGFEKVWRFPEVWLLFVGKTTYLMLPVAQIDQATLALITENISRHGGQVI